MSPKLRACVGATLLVVGLASGARAQESGLKLDTYRGPIVGSSRVIGLGGAFAGVAEGIEGFLRNPASLGGRPAHSTDWWDWDVTLDWLITPGGKVDMDNDGVPVDADATFRSFNVGGSMTFAYLAIGYLISSTSYLFGEGNDYTFGAATTESLLGASWAFADGEWVVGAGWGRREFELRYRGDAEQRLGYVGDAFEAGLIWRPVGLPLRAGLQLRTPSESRTDGAADDFAGREAPEVVLFPGRVTVGASVFFPFGDRVYNHHFKGERWGESWRGPDDRRYLLVAADVVVDTASEGAHNMEGYVGGQPLPTGSSATMSLHLGVESEVFHDRLRLRLGTYSEPRRTTGTIFSRTHGTGSMELRLFDLWIWRIKLTGGFDVAYRYANYLLGIGIWH